MLHKQVYVRLRLAYPKWTLDAKDFDGAAGALLARLGAQECLATDKLWLRYGYCIEGKSPVVPFHEGGTDLRPLGTQDWYCRVDYEAGVKCDAVHRRRRYTLLKVSERDVIRWSVANVREVQRCRNLPPVELQLPRKVRTARSRRAMVRDVRPVVLHSVEGTEHNGGSTRSPPVEGRRAHDIQDKMWAKLLQLPIERTPIVLTPLSFEIVILAARNAHEAAGGNRPGTIVDVWAWVREELGVPKDCDEQLDEALRSLQHEMDKVPDRRRCPTCDREV